MSGVIKVRFRVPFVLWSLLISKIKSLDFCDPDGARTHDPNIKSVVLYQLSYGINNVFLKKVRKDNRI